MHETPAYLYKVGVTGGKSANTYAIPPKVRHSGWTQYQMKTGINIGHIGTARYFHVCAYFIR